jgi:hypothetical protein
MNTPSHVCLSSCWKPPEDRLMLLARSPQIGNQTQECLAKPIEIEFTGISCVYADSLDSTAHLHPPKIAKLENMTRVGWGKLHVRAGSFAFIIEDLSFNMQIELEKSSNTGCMWIRAVARRGTIRCGHTGCVYSPRLLLSSPSYHSNIYSIISKTGHQNASGSSFLFPK